MLELAIIAGTAALLYFGFSQKTPAPSPGGLGPSKPAPINTGTLDVVLVDGVQRFSPAAQQATLIWLAGEGLTPVGSDAPSLGGVSFLVTTSIDPTGQTNAANAASAAFQSGADVYLRKDRTSMMFTPSSLTSRAQIAGDGQPFVLLLG